MLSGHTFWKIFGNVTNHGVKGFHRCANYAAQVEFKLSDIGEGIREVTVKEWFVKVGDKVAQFDEICEVQSDKASVTITSRYDGVIKKLHYKIDDVALVGNPLVDIETEGSEEVTIEKPKEEVPNIEEVQVNKNNALCIPSVRRLAKQYKIDLSNVKGTGKQERILKEDVLKYLEGEPIISKTTKEQPQEIIQQKPKVSEKDSTESIKGFQKAMVKTMTDALKIPHFVYGDEIIVTELSNLRQRLKKIPEVENLKISFMPFFIKAAANTLQTFKILNSTLDEKCENITYKGEINIGIAMDTKVGLAVPVIKNANKLSIIEISNELNRLIKSGRNGTFTLQELSGATFTISNIGMIGGTHMKPVIMPPQVAIMAIGASQVLPRFDDSRNVIAQEIVTVSGAADHRIVDGATMARFIQNVKKQIENPYLLFINLS